MAVKTNNKYRHYGNQKHYDLICISNPVEEKPKGFLHEQKVFHTEKKEWITLYNNKHGAYTDYDEYFVIYQSEDDMNAEHLYARPVDMFFGQTDDDRKRFVEIPKKYWSSK